MTTTLAHLFTPHHTNNHRARILHPAGLTVLIAIVLISQTMLNLVEHVGILPEGIVLGYASNITSVETIDLSNQERIHAGLEPLTHSPLLTSAAHAKATHMFANDYWAHIAPDGTTPWYFIKNANYTYSVAGENLARDFDNTSTMVRAWMDSPTHRDNILNSKYTDIGIAVVNGKLDGVETTLVVQMFGKPTTAIAQTTDTAVTNSSPPEVEAAETPLVPQAPEIVEELPAETSIPAHIAGATLSDPSPLTTAIISPLTVSKSITASVMLLLVGVLAYDMIIIHQKRLPRRVGKNWAHLTLFLMAATIILITSQGVVV